MIGQTISHYKIVEKLGEGGMGVVYKATDTKLDRTVALKFLPPHLSDSEDNKSRFLQEAKAAAALSDPHILNIYEIDEQNGNMFLVMEYIQGKTLRQYLKNLKSSGGIPVPQAIEWTQQIARGLNAAHSMNIIHRDIKPENIMVTPDNRMKIMDFGLAKLKGSAGLTRTGQSLGTLSYMSPEQAQGIKTDQRTDIWSLGVVFYELLTGEVPFTAEHDAALIYLIANENPPAPSAFDRKIPHQIDVFVKKLLEKDTGQRFQTVQEVMKNLEFVKKEIDETASSDKTKSIAVLPFENISPEKESEYFSDGLTEELIIHLSRLKDIGVVSRTTTMQYKGTKKDIKTIGRELGARYIIEGSVRKFQDNLRIAVQLIDVESDRQLWAETYKGKLADVFDIQEQVSKQIVDALMVKLSPGERVILSKRPTANAEAFDYNLRARNYFYRLTKNNVNLGIQLFHKAIELDPRYADAYAGLGEAHAIYYAYFERSESRLEKAIEFSMKALMYDSNLSEAYAALGLAYYYQEKYDEALTAINKSIELDPNNFFGYWILGRLYFTIDRENDAVEPFEKVIALNPDFYTVYSDLKMTYERLGNKVKVKEMDNKTLMLYPDYLGKNPDDARARLFYASDLANAGKLAEAKSEMKMALELSPNDSVMFYNAACFYAGVGEKHDSIKSLVQAVEAGFHQVEWIKRDPDLDPIRDEPGYVELMKDK
jgi:serine/threonine protein kinase/cytochrome c-type biogenesis protein CcmH/NrfG